MSATKLPSRWDGIEERLPRRLEDLHGPAKGILALPLRLAWSGMREFDLDVYRQRLAAYHVVVAEVRHREDVEQYLNATHLIEVWPDLRRFFGPPIRRAWETRFPSLAARAARSSSRG